MSQQNIDVLIVGAGPVGLFCANEVMRHGLTCRIIDKKTQLSEQSKALGIHIRTLNVLEDCGCIDEILQQGHKVEGVLFKSKGKTLVDASFASIDADRHYLIDLPQNQTEAILAHTLQAKGTPIEWETELTHVSQSPTEITATIRKPNNKIELVNANWLIACDGAHSTVRHQVQAEFKGAKYDQTWWLADLLIDWQISDKRMVVYITNQGPLACFPMGNKRYRLVLSAPPGEKPTDLTLEDIQQVFKERSSDPATLSHPIWLSQFSLHHRQIQQYRYDRMFFAGDAAHIHSPMGGQGLNTGIQDIYNLVWKLALVEKNRAKKNLLDSYNTERFPVGHDVLKKTDFMTRMILLTNPLAIWLRNHMMHLMSSLPFIKKHILEDLAELSVSYPNSPIVHQSGRMRHLKAGQFLPDFILLHAQTYQQIHSRTITEGPLHHLFLFSGLKARKAPELMKMALKLAEHYADTMKVHIVLAEDLQIEHPVLSLFIDLEQRIHRQFGLKKSGLILVRPDKYLGIVQKPINEQLFLKQCYLLPS